jgi:excinuclease ABC subunit A
LGSRLSIVCSKIHRPLLPSVKRAITPLRTMELDYLSIKGARQHNLRIEEIQIPKKKLVVFTGVSGSGKSSLAFDSIYAEVQRRYV